MRLDFNETNILATALTELGRNPKNAITKAKLIELLYAIGVHTDKKYDTLRKAVKSLIAKIEKISDNDVAQILADNQNKKIISSVCYQLPSSSRHPS